MATWNEWIDILKKDNVDVQWTIRVYTSDKASYFTVNNNEILEDSISLTEGIISGKDIKFGRMERNYFSVKIKTSDGIISAGKWLSVIFQNGDGAYFSLGEFRVESAEIDMDGFYNVSSYTELLQNRKISGYFAQSIKAKGLNTFSPMKLGLLYYSIMQELGIDIVTSEFSGYNAMYFSDTENGISETITNYVGGVNETYRITYFDAIASFPIESGFKTYYPYCVKDTSVIALLNKIGCTSSNYETKSYLIEDPVGMYSVNIINPARILLNQDYMSKCSIRNRIKIEKGINGVFQQLYDLNLYKNNPRVFYKDYVAYPVFSESDLVNFRWNFETILDGSDCKTFTEDMTYVDILESVLELSACFLINNRNSNIPQIWSFDSTNLYPHAGLYPNTSLYPVGNILNYDKSMQYLNKLDYKKTTGNYFKNLITSIVLSVNEYCPNINTNGSIDYDMSDNILPSIFNMNASEPSGIVGITNIVDKLAPIKFDSFSLQAIGLPNVVPGSKISIQAQDGTQVESYIMTRKLTGTKLLQDKLANNITGGI